MEESNSANPGLPPYTALPPADTALSLPLPSYADSVDMPPAVLAALDTPLPAYTPSQVAQVAEQSGTELVNTDGMPPIAVQPTAQIFTDCLKAANARREAQRQAIYAIRYCEECSFCDNSTANPTASDIFNNWCGFIHLCPQGCICVACIEAEYYRDIACNAKDCKSASKCACSVCVCCTSVLLVPVPYFIGLALSPAVCICAHFYTFLCNDSSY